MVSNDTSEHCSVFVFVDEIVDLDCKREEGVETDYLFVLKIYFS